MEFSLAKEMLKNNKIILDNTIKIKTAEIELANEELKDLNFQSEKREKFLETLFEAIPFPIFYKNEHFRYIKCNTAFADFLGKSKKEIYGKTVYDISPARLAEVYHKEDKKLSKKANDILNQRLYQQMSDRNNEINEIINNMQIIVPVLPYDIVQSNDISLNRLKSALLKGQQYVINNFVDSGYGENLLFYQKLDSLYTLLLNSIDANLKKIKNN